MNTGQEVYAKSPDIFYTGEIVDCEEVARPATWDEISAARRAEFEERAADPWGDLSGKTPEQINNLIHALAPLIDLYSKSVTNAEERCQQEREFLAGTTALYLRLTHATARRAAEALELTAIATEARRAATEGAVHEGAGPTDIAQPSPPINERTDR